MQKQYLKPYEWATISCFIGAIGSVISIALLSPAKEERPSYRSETIDILVSGAVKYPGIYKCPRGISTQTLFAIADLLPEGDKRKLSDTTPITQSRRFKIQKKKTVAAAKPRRGRSLQKLQD